MEPATPMRNADFRQQLLAAGRTPAVSASSFGFQPKAQEFAKPALPDDRKKREKATRWRAIVDQRTEEQKLHDQKYRDRAKERRNDVNPDYKDQNFQVDDEQSKYLGGDIDHTHLVKGLDLALLERVRAGDMQQESVTDQQLEDVIETAPKSAPKSVAPVEQDPLTSIKSSLSTRMGKALYTQLLVPLSQLDLAASIAAQEAQAAPAEATKKHKLAEYFQSLVNGEAKSMIGLGIDASCLVRDRLDQQAKSAKDKEKEPQSIPLETFLPKRMAFTFALAPADPMLDERKVPSAPPTTVLRARADCPAPPDVSTADVAASLDDRLHRVMTLLRGGSIGTKKKIESSVTTNNPTSHQQKVGAVPVMPQKVATAPVAQLKSKQHDSDSDDDIFSNVGSKYEYKPSAVEKARKSTEELLAEINRQSANAPTRPKHNDDMDLSNDERSAKAAAPTAPHFHPSRAHVPASMSSHNQSAAPPSASGSSQAAGLSHLDPAMARLFGRQEAWRVKPDKPKTKTLDDLMNAGDEDDETLEYSLMTSGGANAAYEDDDDDGSGKRRPPVDEKSAMRKNAADNFNQMFQQVNNIMQKRKQEGGGGGAEKRIKY